MEGGANSTYSSQYGGVVQSSAPLMEGLQSVLKQRDGEVQQLQWEIHRLQTERNFLSNEMSNLTIELEKVNDERPPKLLNNKFDFLCRLLIR